MKRALLAASLLTLGCGTEGSSQLQVELLSVSGTLDGRSIDGTEYTESGGERFNDVGTFYFEGRTATMSIAVCPLDDLEVDPYANGGEGRPPFEDADGDGIPDGDGMPTTTIGGVDCGQRGMTICVDATCGSFGQEAVQLQIVDESGWRRVVVDADDLAGVAHVELRYRETH